MLSLSCEVNSSCLMDISPSDSGHAPVGLWVKFHSKLCGHTWEVKVIDYKFIWSPYKGSDIAFPKLLTTPPPIKLCSHLCLNVLKETMTGYMHRSIPPYLDSCSHKCQINLLSSSISTPLSSQRHVPNVTLHLRSSLFHMFVSLHVPCDGLASHPSRVF